MEKEKKREKIRFQLHPKQAEVFHNDCRFRVVVAGRRWGKSKLSMAEMLAWATKKRQKIWYVAPTYKMAKQIMWNELKMMVPREWVTKIRENELSMEFRNGSRIDLKGADKPDSLRGVSLDFLVLDEFQDISPDTWKTVLRPTLADRKGHALFIGCVRGDTRIMSDKGVTSIESHCTNLSPQSLTPIDLNLYGIDKAFHKADNFWNNGIVETRKIKTHFGFEIEASLPHPLWTIDENGNEGWKKTEDLQVGDRVAIARGMEQWGNQSIMQGWEEHYAEWKKQYRKSRHQLKFQENLDLAYFLGLWIAEGSFEEKIGRLSITCGDPDVGSSLDERVFGVPFKPVKNRTNQWRINSYAVLEFMRFIGMPLTTAPNKSLPAWMWTCSREFAATVLSGMWDGDGYVLYGKKKIAGYTTSSKRLAQDVQLLLTNFGIVSRLTAVVSHPTERVKVCSTQYRVAVYGENLRKLRDVLKLRIERKAARLAAIGDLVSKRDTVPVYPLLKKLKTHFVQKATPVLWSCIHACESTCSEPTYPSLRTILEETKSVEETPEYQKLKRIVANNYYWDTVEQIDKSECQTYDFTVPDTHSFWSNGFISHNTPKGFNLLYEVYRLGQVKENQMRHKWMSWQFPTIVSPFIPQAEIDSARRDMDEKSFRQEFCHLPTTKVKLWDGGTRAIKDVRIGDALVYVGDHGRLERCTVTDKRNTGLQKMMRVTLDDGSTFTASKKHKIKYGQEKYQLCNAVYLQRWVNGWFKTLKVVKREELPPEECMNITVDSPDHSYLLADGIDNFNCASFESMSGRVYYAFDRKQHVANVEFNPKLPIWVGMDFNIDPMSTVIFQPQPNGQIWAVDEIVQVASNTDDICTELEKRYYKYQNQVTVYPDPAGSARQHARGESDLDIIREHGFKRIKVKRAHSAVADRINAVNRVLRTASGDVRLFINPKCKHLIESFEQTLYIAGTRDVDKALGVEHSADAAGYCIEIEFPLRKFTAAGYSR